MCLLALKRPEVQFPVLHPLTHTKVSTTHLDRQTTGRSQTPSPRSIATSLACPPVLLLHSLWWLDMCIVCVCSGGGGGGEESGVFLAPHMGSSLVSSPFKAKTSKSPPPWQKPLSRILLSSFVLFSKVFWISSDICACVGGMRKADSHYLHPKMWAN